jgi:hypothetical protein
MLEGTFFPHLQLDEVLAALRPGIRDAFKSSTLAYCAPDRPSLISIRTSLSKIEGLSQTSYSHR